MGLISEFKDFIAKGNAFDLAVGVIIGGAFAPIINSMVADIIMPLVSLLGGGKTDFSNLYIPLSVTGVSKMKDLMSAGLPVLPLKEAQALGSVLAYGNLLNAIVTFIFLMLGVFILVKLVNSLKKKEEAKPSAAPEPTREAVLLTEIRDALVARK